MKSHLWSIKFIGVIVPRRLRADWRQEWEAELLYRESLLADWDKLDTRNKLALVWHSLGALMDALWLQPRRWEDEMFQDMRYGFRMQAKNPGFALIAILTLALGIGANTAIFSIINVALLRPLPFVEPDRLVLMAETHPAAPRLEVATADFKDWQQQAQSFTEMAAWSLDEQPIQKVRSMEEAVSASLARRRLSALLTGCFAALALLLSAIGIYGVLAWTVNERTREMGIRIALGAPPGDVLRLVIAQGMELALIGLVVGLVASLPAARAMKRLLFGVGASDPVTFMAIAILILLTALLACYLPAQRATKVDPLVALRHD